MSKKLPEIRRTARPALVQSEGSLSDEVAPVPSVAPETSAEMDAEPAAREHDRRSDLRQAKAQTIVANYATSASACGLLPLPLVDVVGISAVQLAMVAALCRHYGVPYSRSWASALVGSIVGGSLPKVLTRGIAKSFFKAMPVAGALFGIAGVAALANLSTRSLGKLFMDHFEAGGDLETADSASLKAAYEQEMRKERG